MPWTCRWLPLVAGVGLVTLSAAWGAEVSNAQVPGGLQYEIRLQTVLEHDDGKFLWYHPRAAAIPGGTGGQPEVMLTLQQHLRTSDHYSGLFAMRSTDLGVHWSRPDPRPELAWRKESDRVTIAVADVTPGWHAPTRRLLALGAQVRYSAAGEQLEDQPRAHQTAYASFDPATGAWTGWQTLEMPKLEQFNFARSACAQWIVRPDGALLVPFYFGRNATEPFRVMVAECGFDGTRLVYRRHGTELSLPVVRGLCEPSLAVFEGRYYLTLRNDLRAM